MNSHETSILETRDRGTSFRSLGTVTGYGGITFQTATQWWSVGTCCASAQSVYRSSDGGLKWDLDAPSTDTWEPVSDFVWVDASRGYRVVREGASPSAGFERTRDAGRSFERVALPKHASDVLSATAEGCALLADGGTILYTLDMGTSWAALPALPAHAVSGWPDGFLASARLYRTSRGWLAVKEVQEATSALFVLQDVAGQWDELAPTWTEKGAASVVDMALPRDHSSGK